MNEKSRKRELYTARAMPLVNVRDKGRERDNHESCPSRLAVLVNASSKAISQWKHETQNSAGCVQNSTQKADNLKVTAAQGSELKGQLLGNYTGAKVAQMLGDYSGVEAAHMLGAINFRDHNSARKKGVSTQVQSTGVVQSQQNLKAAHEMVISSRVQNRGDVDQTSHDAVGRLGSEFRDESAKESPSHNAENVQQADRNVVDTNHDLVTPTKTNAIKVLDQTSKHLSNKSQGKSSKNKRDAIKKRQQKDANVTDTSTQIQKSGQEVPCTLNTAPRSPPDDEEDEYRVIESENEHYQDTQSIKDEEEEEEETIKPIEK
ncbi:hypothetical protein FXO38_18282 [Capsicum annuum]|nr:hypothetical protein FXO38_18282 [Capsicum annuum]KAF3678276.1 hypothetical protein FXO37_04449 [Capsicum annuum]